MNEKREQLNQIESRDKVSLVIVPNPHMQTPAYTLRRVRDDEKELPENTTVSYQLADQPSVDDSNIGNRDKKPPGDVPLVPSILPALAAPIMPMPVPAAAPAAVRDRSRWRSGQILALAVWRSAGRAATASPAPTQPNATGRRIATCGMIAIAAAGTVTETATAIGMCAVTRRVMHNATGSAIRAAMDVRAAISARDARAPASQIAIQAASVTRHRGPVRISHSGRIKRLAEIWPRVQIKRRVQIKLRVRISRRARTSPVATTLSDRVASAAGGVVVAAAAAGAKAAKMQRMAPAPTQLSVPVPARPTLQRRTKCVPATTARLRRLQRPPSSRRPPSNRFAPPNRRGRSNRLAPSPRQPMSRRVNARLQMRRSNQRRFVNPHRHRPARTNPRFRARETRTNTWSGPLHPATFNDPGRTNGNAERAAVDPAQH